MASLSGLTYSSLGLAPSREQIVVSSSFVKIPRPVQFVSVIDG